MQLGLCGQSLQNAEKWLLQNATAILARFCKASLEFRIVLVLDDPETPGDCKMQSKFKEPPFDTRNKPLLEFDTRSHKYAKCFRNKHVFSQAFGVFSHFDFRTCLLVLAVSAVVKHLQLESHMTEFETKSVPHQQALQKACARVHYYQMHATFTTIRQTLSAPWIGGILDRYRLLWERKKWF